MKRATASKIVKYMPWYKPILLVVLIALAILKFFGYFNFSTVFTTPVVLTIVVIAIGLSLVELFAERRLRQPLTEEEERFALAIARRYLERIHHESKD